MRDRPHLGSVALGDGGQPQPITARWDNVLDEAELAALLDQLPAT